MPRQSAVQTVNGVFALRLVQEQSLQRRQSGQPQIAVRFRHRNILAYRKRFGRERRRRARDLACGRNECGAVGASAPATMETNGKIRQFRLGIQRADHGQEHSSGRCAETSKTPQGRILFQIKKRLKSLAIQDVASE